MKYVILFFIVVLFIAACAQKETVKDIPSNPDTQPVTGSQATAEGGVVLIDDSSTPIIEDIDTEQLDLIEQNLDDINW